MRDMEKIEEWQNVSENFETAEESFDGNGNNHNVMGYRPETCTIKITIKFNSYAI